MRSLFLTNTIKPLSKMVAIALSLGWLTAGAVEAASFTFSKIVDTNTPIPGGGGNFTFLNTPVIDNGIVVFSGERGNQGRVEQRGIYTYAGGMLQTVVDTNTPVPFSDVNFIGLDLGLAIDKGNIVFGGSGNKPNPLGGTDVYGIYTVIGGVLDRVIDQSTILPGDNSNFTTFGGGLSIKGNNVAFYGGSSFENVALFTNAGGTLQRVVDSSTPLPEVTSNLDSLSNADVVFASSTSVDGTINNWRSGIYTYTGGVIKKIVDPATIMLGGRTDLNFSAGQPLVDNDDIAFSVVSYSNQPSTAIYTIVDGKVSLIADTNTPVPGGIGNFFNLAGLNVGSFNFGGLSLDQGSVAFVGGDLVGFREFPGPICSPRQFCPGPIRFPEIRNGIYTTLGGSLTRVIAEGEQLDGKVIAPYYLGVSRQMLSGNSLVFSVRFTDGSSGIYQADFVPHPPKSVPEPASVLGLLPAVGALLLRRRKEGKKAVV
ncbi:DUF7453 family protein [Microseira wollei]|uniref:PEP-CTERM protein-sorting domain-containing protein n=1 Tax=Microseira wollei NIES-4236 TaxID=2530354 RepID=A0AAV3XEJ2_9CYAN|nr:PEP-CTERM sorting domain-containing protein [Microseira wollei]GET38530.1 hypothetical protein MiSe_32880 [Microseira wollei NIES-4236]